MNRGCYIPKGSVYCAIAQRDRILQATGMLGLGTAGGGRLIGLATAIGTITGFGTLPILSAPTREGLGDESVQSYLCERCTARPLD